MPVMTENMGHRASFLIEDGPGYYSRDQALVASGSGVLSSATVLGQVTATGLFAPLDPAAGDGSEVAVAVLFARCDASDADARVTIVARHAQVMSSALIWPEAATGEQKSTATKQLAANGIIAR